jgi:uncharacterized membrane-anchored protein YitT (DUF2179 family)
MPYKKVSQNFSFSKYYLKTLIWTFIGAFLAAGAIDIILIPNNMIDGGVVGVAMMAAYLTSESLLPYFLILLNLPFLWIAYKHLGKHFVIQMITALVFFAVNLKLVQWIPHLFWPSMEPLGFYGSDIEVIILGGVVLGFGLGLIIRMGGSTDGTEIVGILVNKKQGYSVGQVILASNILIFVAAVFVYQNWHPAFMSLMTYIVATKIIDMVIVGLEDTKSAMIISSNPKHLADVLIHELGISLTVMYGRGGFSGDTREILYIVVERLQLAELKEIIQREDPTAFIAVQNLHEVLNGRQQPGHLHLPH